MVTVVHANLAGTNLHEDKRIKQAVRAASTANVSLTAPGATLDGVTLATNDRILLKNQSTPSQNGIYLWTGASATLTRTSDAAVAADFVYGFLVFAREGTANAATYWEFTQTAAITIGTTALTFASFGAAATGTFSGEVSGTDFSATGLTGATSGMRIVGATAGGPPASGTFAIGDFVLDRTATIGGPLGWKCTVAGTPGTWVPVSTNPMTTVGDLIIGGTVANGYSAATRLAAAAAGLFLGGNGTGVAPSYQTPPSMIASGGSHAAGYAPDPGSSAGTTKYLREDASWQVPPGSGTSPLAINARLRISANQSITASTATAINWDTEDTDSDAQHYTSSANLTGTLAKTNGSAAIVGTSTLFTTELSVGQVISVPGGATEVRVVTAITDNTHLTVNSNFANTSSGQTATRVNSALVFRTSGFYWIQTGLYWASAVAGTMTAQIRLNGSTMIGETDESAITAAEGQQVNAAQSFAQWDYIEVIVTQTSSGALNVNTDQRTYLACGVSGYVAAPYINIQDQKAQNTTGGTFTSGSWQTRTLNTIVNDADGVSSLASNQITLPAGTYRWSSSAPARGVDNHQTRLQDITASATLLTGTSEYTTNSGGGVVTRSTISGRFTLAASHALELQHRCATTVTTTGMGTAANLTTEVYTVVEIWKEG